MPLNGAGGRLPLPPAGYATARIANVQEFELIIFPRMMEIMDWGLRIASEWRHRQIDPFKAPEHQFLWTLLTTLFIP